MDSTLQMVGNSTQSINIHRPGNQDFTLGSAGDQDASIEQQSGYSVEKRKSRKHSRKHSRASLKSRGSSARIKKYKKAYGPRDDDPLYDDFDNYSKRIEAIRNSLSLNNQNSSSNHPAAPPIQQ